MVGTRRKPGSVRRPLVENSTSKSDCLGAGEHGGNAQKMETDENSSGALGAGEHGGGSHQLQSPGSNPLGVGQGGNAAEGYVAKYAAKEDTKVNRSLSGREMLN